MLDKILVIAGDDKLGRLFISKLPNSPAIVAVFDRSNDFRRILKILLRGSLTPTLFLKMGLADLARRNTVLSRPVREVRTNSDIRRLSLEYNIRRAFLFRAAIIVDRETLATGVEFINTHCATLPHYRGLGAISRALAEGNYRQNATMHKISTSVDYGETVAVEPYTLIPALSYKANEDIAYEAGMRLLLREIPA
ncbi:MAG: hypothetical protein A3J74_05720 [Elusimicrobia bacterium RIFCSPHIGHO2_02_FULL_57_9]|nr:MAG: hypothetical protein A3J74_05720 [Elusimicrobia bacterium RIFCSPHIGHO2_02_FULL_57_9]